MHGDPCCYDRLNYLGAPHPECQCHPGAVRNTDTRPHHGGPDTNSTPVDLAADAGTHIPQPVPIAYGDQSPLF